MEIKQTRNGHELTASQIWVVGIVLALTGLCFRLYHLGFNGFWFDEIGVANVFHANNLLDVLKISKSHVMAMPLDYFVIYLLSKLGQSEFLLRLPAAIWGCLSILVLFRIVYRISGKMTTATLTALLLIISPIHIHYSQELRFYSSLVFFFLFCFARLMDALEDPSNSKWMVYFISMIVGCFFHIYVLFVMIPGVYWFLLKIIKKEKLTEKVGFFILTNLMLGLMVISGIVFLTSNSHTGTEYENLFGQVTTVLFQGLGIVPSNGSYTGLFEEILLGLCFGAVLVGLISLLRDGKNDWNQVIGLTFLSMPVLIIGLDIYKQYFISPKQLIFLVPFTCYILISGLTNCMDRLNKKFENQYKGRVHIESILITILVFSLYIQGVYYYYQWPKSFVREVTEVLIDDPEMLAAKIYVTPVWDVLSYMYYYEEIQKTPYTGRLLGFNIVNLGQIDFQVGDYVIIEDKKDPATIEELLALGFEPIVVHHALEDRSDILWKLTD